jgi:hypothetical protein
MVRWILLPSAGKVRYVSARTEGGRRFLAGAYVRWWRDLATASLPAVRDAARRFRRSGPGKRPV